MGKGGGGMGWEGESDGGVWIQGIRNWVSGLTDKGGVNVLSMKLV